MNAPGDHAIYFTLTVLSHMQKDLESYESVFKNPSLDGKLGIGLISNACAAMNLFAWLLYQRFGNQQKTETALFTELINDRRFFDKEDFPDADVLYKLVRCGVIHQYFPKGLMIIVHDSEQVFGLDEYSRVPAVNAIGFYKTALKGLEKITKHIGRLDAPIEELANYDLKLAIRQRSDSEEAGFAKFDTSKLHPFTPKFGSAYEF